MPGGGTTVAVVDDDELFLEPQVNILWGTLLMIIFVYNRAV